MNNNFMTWALVNNSKSLLQEYHLTNDEGCKVILKYNPGQNSARVSCGIHQRLFFIESTGQLSAKKLLMNEYGIEAGHIYINNKHNKILGTITVDSKKYSFETSDKRADQLHIYNYRSQEKLVTCLISAPDKRSASFSIDSFSGFLLLGLCWFLSLPLERKEIPGFAA